MDVSHLSAHDMSHIAHAGAYTHECGDFDELGCGGFHAAPSIRMRVAILTAQDRNKKPGAGPGLLTYFVFFGAGLVGFCEFDFCGESCCSCICLRRA